MAVGFLALAVVVSRERKKVAKVEHPMPGNMTHVWIPGPVAAALKRILWVEVAGVILAATAAAYEALT